MIVRIAGNSDTVKITPDDVDGDVRWCSSGLCEGRLLDGRIFRCLTTPRAWMRFMLS